MPVDLTPDERRLRAQTAANDRWSRPGARQRQSEKISASKLARHEKLVDPAGRAQELRDAAATRRLTSPERAELAEIVARAENSLRAEMARLALKSSKARRGRGRAQARTEGSPDAAA
jgi:hypothetical protein